MKKGLKKTNTCVGKVVGILLKLCMCEGSIDKAAVWGDGEKWIDLREIQQFGLI